MKLYSIKLENFKNHKNFELNFEDKNIIIGENGVGKTSIFQAILFSLFGKDSLSYINISNTSSLIRYNSPSSKIELEFGDQEKYRVVRIINNNGESKVILYKGDNIVATGPDLVNKKIKEILNIKRVEKFSEILYIKQGELGKYILLSGKLDLTKKLENIFDIDYYSLILRIIESLIRDMEKEKEYEEREKNILLKDIDTYRNLFGNRDIEELLKEVEKYNELKKYRDEIYKDYLELKTLQNNIDYELLSQENFLNEKLKELEEKLKELNNNIINIESEKRNLKYEKYSKDLLYKSLDYLENRKKELEKYENIDKKELEYKLKELKELESDIEKFLNNKNIEEEFKEIENKLKEIEKNISIIENKIKEEEEYINILNKEISECPVCKRELDKDLHKKLLEEYKNSIENDKNKLKELEEEKYNLEKVYEDKYNKYKYYLYIKEKIFRKNININNIEDEKNRIEKEIEEIDNEIKNIEEYNIIKDTINYIKKNEIEKTLENLKKEYNNLNYEVNKIREKIIKINNMKMNLEKIKEIYSKYNFSSISEFEEKIKYLDNELKKYENIRPELIKNYKEKLDRYNNIIEKIKKINKNINNLRSLYNALLKFIEVRREKLSKDLENAFRYYFKKLYKYQDIIDVGIDIKEGKNKEEKLFHIYIIKNIDNREVKKYVEDAGLSGGQIKILDLSLRLSIASLLKLKINTLLLDEPTESLDENVRISLAQLLNSLDNYQIVLCTHDELFKENIEGKIIEIKR
ncbi:DNA double-strand break repair Rad50 ATPase [Nanoarchaeota archaeon]